MLPVANKLASLLEIFSSLITTTTTTAVAAAAATILMRKIQSFEVFTLKHSVVSL